MNTIIASGPVIIENEKVLLNKHGDDNFWKFPGGKWEGYDLSDWETALEEVARREVKEEMGIDIEIIQPLKPMMIKKDGSTIVILIHWLSRRIGDIRPGNDILEWAWHDIHALPADCAPNIKPVIASFLIER